MFSSLMKHAEYLHYFKERMFRGEKISRVTSNEAFHENLAFANDYFEVVKLDSFRNIQASLFQFSTSWPVKFILRGINVRQLPETFFSRVKPSRKCTKSRETFSSRTFVPIK